MVKSLAVLGTGSDVGKTTIAAGICRILNNNGIRVAPFKAQNMSNNAEPAFITPYDNNDDNGNDNDDTIEERRTASNTNTTNIAHTQSSSLHTSRWGEIGTAQALQAEACRIPPLVEMNPILLKSGGTRPSTDNDNSNDETNSSTKKKSTPIYLCNVIVNGKSLTTETYGELGKRTATLQNLVLSSHTRLASLTQSEIIIIEGAGSCTELNLMERDVVNLPLVRKLRCPWILVANIDCGGVFAQVVGTMKCVTEEDWKMCVGVVVNRLRGEVRYFEDGVGILEGIVGKKVFVVPWVEGGTGLKEEDGLGVERRLRDWDHALLKCDDDDDIDIDDDDIIDIDNENSNDKPTSTSTPTKKHRILIVAYPHIAITSDITPLENDNNFTVEWRRNTIPAETYPQITALVLPGSRLTRFDLEWMRTTGWIPYITEFSASGGKVLGLCGGYQMLGRVILDPEGVEGDYGGVSVGLGILPIETTIAAADSKIVTPRDGILFDTGGGGGDDGIPVHGFELHCGRSTIKNDDAKLECKPFVTFTDGGTTTGGERRSVDGLVVGNICGTYMHGILNSRTLRRAILLNDVSSDGGYLEDTEEEDDPLDNFANHLEGCGLDFNVLFDMASHQF